MQIDESDKRAGNHENMQRKESRERGTRNDRAT